MSVFFQFPQYFTIGLSEVFTSVASMEFAYLAAPQSAQSLVMSLRFASIGISSLLGSGYISIFKLIEGNYGLKNDEVIDFVLQCISPSMISKSSSVRISILRNCSIFISLFWLVFNCSLSLFFFSVIENFNY